MRIVSLVGARPQFIKAASVSRQLRRRHEEILVHSGQHYDAGMSDVFFSQLEIPWPDYNLGVGGGGHGRQTGAMLGMLEDLLLDLGPDVLLVYGDTNTTLAGALAAAKLAIPVAHVEAGLRSFDRAMPEEINRVLVDHVSTLLLAPTETAVRNLAAEGITEDVEVVGDVMLDTVRTFAEHADVRQALGALDLEIGSYYLATVHRAATSDSALQLASVIEAFRRLDAPVVWAVHPRTRANLERFGLLEAAGSVTTLVEPLSYLDTIALLRGARALLTDSGGMQKEAYFLSVPCVTLRDSTEWIETVALGWNRLAGTESDAIVRAVAMADRPAEHPDVYGDGHAAEAVVAALDRLA